MQVCNKSLNSIGMNLKWIRTVGIEYYVSGKGEIKWDGTERVCEYC